MPGEFSAYHPETDNVYSNEAFVNNPAALGTLAVAEILLSQVITRELPREILDRMIRHPSATFLIDPLPQHDYRSPLALLRAKMEYERGRGNWDKAAVLKRISQLPQPLLEIVGSMQQVKSMVNSIPSPLVAHLARQDVIGIEQVQEICDTFNPIILQTSPSQSVHIGPAIRQILADRGVLFLTNYMDGNRVQYEIGSSRAQFLSEQQLFAMMLQNDTEKTLLYVNMLDLGMEPATVAQCYFVNEMASAMVISDLLGLPVRRVQKHLQVFKAWMGVQYESLSIQTSAIELEASLDRILHIRESAPERYMVDGKIPPSNLRRDRWAVWQRVMVIMSERPDLIQSLKQLSQSKFQSGRLGDVLATFLQIPTLGICLSSLNFMDKNHSGMHPVTYQKLCIDLHHALKFLGISDQDH